jgi:hypothetical protein
MQDRRITRKLSAGLDLVSLQHHGSSREQRSLSQRGVNGEGRDRGILDAEICEAQRVQASQAQTICPTRRLGRLQGRVSRVSIC